MHVMQPMRAGWPNHGQRGDVGVRPGVEKEGGGVALASPRGQHAVQRRLEAVVGQDLQAWRRPLTVLNQ